MRDDDIQERDHQSSFTEPLAPGTRLRQYVLRETLGAGGFGITYRAVHATLTDKTFAIKEYFPRAFAIRIGQIVRSTTSDGGRDMFAFGLVRFLQEAEILARCEHPSIVDVIDYFEENGTAYSVLSYVSGDEMSRWLSRLGRPPSQVELDRLIVPLLGALEALHRNDLLHRDIAPDNILVKGDGTPCLIDFGAARADMSVASSATAAFIKTGFSPPEQYVGRADLQGPWTDIYALGATLYRAVTGASPPEAVARQFDRDLSIDVAARSGDYRKEFLEAINWSLHLKPRDRPQSVAEWRNVLLAGVEATKQTALPREQPVTPPVGPDTAGKPARLDAPWRSPRRAEILTIIASVIACLAVAGGVWGLKRQPDFASLPQASAILAPTKGSAPLTAPGIDTGHSQVPLSQPGQQLADLWRECLSYDAATKIVGCRRIIAVSRETAMQSEDLAEAHLHLGIGLKEKGALIEAEESLNEGLRLFPRLADAYFNRALIYAERSQHGRAIDDFGRSIEINQNHAEAIHRRALSLFRSGRIGDALSDANRSISLAPRRVDYLETRGHVNEALGRKGDAIADFQRALEIDPNAYGSREALRRLTAPPPVAVPSDAARSPPTSRREATIANASARGRSVHVEVTVERRAGPIGLLDRTWVGANIEPVGEAWARVIGLSTPEGALVTSIATSSPASRSDLKVGDIVLKAGGRLIHDSKDLPAHIQTLAAGASLTLEVWRIGEAGEDYMQVLRRVADGGQVEAMLRLGMLLAEGTAVARNDAEALRWLRLAAEKGLLTAAHQYGQLLFAGRGAVKDAAEGYRWVKLAADGGLAVAMRSVAHAHYRGEGAEKSNSETLRWLMAAAEAKSADAMADLGDAYSQGLLGVKDLGVAVKWYRMAADSGHTGAMAALGIAFTNGIAVPKDAITAASWYRKSAEGGNAVGMNNLAAVLDRGLGVSRNPEEAARWMLAAIDQNSTFSIGQMQRNANAWTPDFRRSIQRLLKEAGFYNGAVDGSFGAGTIGAVQAYASRKR